MAGNNYYRLLGIAPNADTAAVRSAYHALARVHHPDYAGGSSEVMVALNEAWAVLGNASARSTYDADRGLSATGMGAGANAASSQTAPSPAKADPNVLDFGRYAGWSLRDLVREDPDYLLWLERTTIGRRYQAAIAALFRPAPGPAGRSSRFATAHGR